MKNDSRGITISGYVTVANWDINNHLKEISVETDEDNYIAENSELVQKRLLSERNMD
jgi:hypothetical protein